jgi:hypothetical protein
MKKNMMRTLENHDMMKNGIPNKKMMMEMGLKMAGGEF